MNKIYISTSSIKEASIAEIFSKLVEMGITHFELSGGLSYKDDLLDDLLNLQKQYKLNLLLHNYFPPPKKPFVLNLSAPGEAGEQSLLHAKKTIQWSKELNATKLAFHAGFLIDIPIEEIGKSIKKRKLIDKDEALNNFRQRVSLLKKIAGEEVDLYIENNVVSAKNYKNFDSINPFLFTDQKSWEELELQGVVKPLIDIAHLKVSCKTLDLNFEEEWHKLSKLTDYIHVSDNDGFSDNNRTIKEDGEIYSLLGNTELNGKTITLEVYDKLDEIKHSYRLIKKVLD